MGSHCGKPLKSKSKSLMNLQSSGSTSHLEKTTDPHENVDSSPNLGFLEKNCQIMHNFGSLEDVRTVYDIEPAVIGKGKFSTVREASFNGKTDSFALKTILLSSLSKHLKSLLDIELHILRNIHHPLIVKCFESFQDQKFVHIVFEKLNGGDLLSHILTSPKARLEEIEAKTLAFDLFSTVEFLHSKGVVHRDIKPENLIFTDKSHSTLKIIDFGLSKNEETKNMTTIVGSPYYIAPEVLKQQGYDKACDVWSLGVILYLMLQGFPPFFSQSIPEQFNLIENSQLEFKEEDFHLSSQAKDLIEKMLVKDPKQRISIKNALKHKFFDEIRQKKSHKNQICPSRLKESILRFLDFKDSFPKEMRLFRNLFLEYALQYMDKNETNLLEKYYSFFDSKFKGFISVKVFMEQIKLLKLELSERKVCELFELINSSFGSYTNNSDSSQNKSAINYNVFCLAMILTHENWLQKSLSKFKGIKINKEWISQAFDRKITKNIRGDMKGFDYEEVFNKLMGHLEELDDENGDERILDKDFAHLDKDRRG